CGQRHLRGPEPKIEARVFRCGGDDGECFDADGVELLASRAELDDGAPAERAPEPAEDREEQRLPSTIIRRGDQALPMNSWQREVGGWLAGPDRSRSILSRHRSVLSLLGRNARSALAGPREINSIFVIGVKRRRARLSHCRPDGVIPGAMSTRTDRGFLAL